MKRTKAELLAANQALAEELAASQKNRPSVYVNVAEIGLYVNQRNELVSIESLEEVLTCLRRDVMKLRCWAEQYAPADKLIEGQIYNFESWALPYITPKVESPQRIFSSEYAN